ncbi:hypothetical protein Mgra_00009840 [Meloidogyne graminicola]|uniref:Aspartate dehydrogenase domain-containing protein n=1 Tax=Meloidogyne graminicola TaxID=189291 RepID=A0A8S9ZBR0_9BILA|nr:hypothetical protein Mgra_00009840 [Meloidogyne graminicola]
MLLKQQLKDMRCVVLFYTIWCTLGSRDIQKMADFGTLSITTMLHPNSLQLAELNVDSSSELKVLHSFCEECKRTNSPKVLYDGTARQLCLMAPNNVNSMASAALAAHTLGFDCTKAKLIVDPELRNWQIIEYEITGENGFRTREGDTPPTSRAQHLLTVYIVTNLKLI